MARRIIQHHSEETVVKAILRLMSSCSTCRVAVAYCGKEAHRFFPEKPEHRPHDLRILVDGSDSAVRWGLTSPKGIERLLGLTSDVKSLPCLHAKVWVFDDKAALVGSVNLSESSIERQFQLAVEICDGVTVRKIAAWFDELWTKSTSLDSKIVERLAGLTPVRQPTARSMTKGKLPRWRGQPPELPLAQSDFEIGVTAGEIKRLLYEFRNNECPYSGSEGSSCFQMSLRTESDYQRFSHDLRRLMRRMSSWGKSELGELFDIAYTNGSAAKLRKPLFARQQSARVARSLEFLLQGTGDPYIRFEKVLASDSGYKLAGMAAPGLSFLMHLWEPEAFAVVNGPIDKALKKLKVRFRASSHREGQRFKDRTAAVKKIAELTGLRTLARVDHFLDALGKGHIG